MANTYAKVFQSILDSSIWQESEGVRLVWITMLALADQDGKVWAAIPGLAHRARVTVEEARQAVDKFLDVDPDSRSKEHEGRRIEVVDGGWRLLNHAKYRKLMSAEERREYKRLKEAEYRARRKPPQFQEMEGLTAKEMVMKSVSKDPLVRQDARVMKKKWKNHEHKTVATTGSNPVQPEEAMGQGTEDVGAGWPGEAPAAADA